MLTTNPDGTVTFRVYLPHATTVELLGDFTDWRRAPVSLRREHPGWWSATLAVPAGEHLFCYLVDASIWLADYAAHGVRQNQFGGWVSRLAVTTDAASPHPALADLPSAETPAPSADASAALAAA